MLPPFLCLLMLLKCPFSITDRHFVTDGLWNYEKCVFTKVIQWIRWSSDLLIFYPFGNILLCNFVGSVCKPNQWHTRWMVHPLSPPQFPYSINLSRTLPLPGPLHRNPLHWRWLFSYREIKSERVIIPILQIILAMTMLFFFNMILSTSQKLKFFPVTNLLNPTFCNPSSQH